MHCHHWQGCQGPVDPRLEGEGEGTGIFTVDFGTMNGIFSYRTCCLKLDQGRWSGAEWPPGSCAAPMRGWGQDNCFIDDSIISIS